MARKKRIGLGQILEKFSQKATQATGTSTAFILALLTIVVWAATGPLFNFSDTWQLVINTGTTIVTFLMVFLIQRTQNKDSLAIHLKLNEIVAALEGASDEHLVKLWTLQRAGQHLLAMPRVAVVRGFVMNHVIHHRAQLGVYLRLNDIPVPSIYGPSADEAM